MGNSTNRHAGAKPGDLGTVVLEKPTDLSLEMKVQTRKAPERKTRRKPRFSLWLHSGTGQWAKKIRGQHYYFGTDKDAALKEYMRVRDDLKAGRKPQPPSSSLVTIKLLGDTFLTHKKSQVIVGELTRTSFNNYEATCQRMADFFGKTSAVESLRPTTFYGIARTWQKRGGQRPLVTKSTVVGLYFDSHLRMA